MTDFTPVINIVYEAGQKLKKYFGNIEAKGYKTSSVADVVTKLDEETEWFLREKLKKIEPAIGFKGEESGRSGSTEKFWLVDPIDGTSLFMRGIWGCTIMLALVEKNQIVFSVIYDFILDKLYTAQLDKGTYLNKKAIHVSSRPLQEAFVYIESDLHKDRNQSIYTKLKQKCFLLTGYPAGIHFAMVAEGKIEGRICLSPWGKDYDFAPGQLLVKEAGGVVANIGTNKFDYRNLNFLAVNTEVYEGLVTGKDPVFPISSFNRMI